MRGLKGKGGVPLKRGSGGRTLYDYVVRGPFRVLLVSGSVVLCWIELVILMIGVCQLWF